MSDPVWREVSDLPDRGQRGGIGVVARAAIPVGFAIVLWVLGLEIPAVAVLLAAFVLVVVRVARPDAAAKIERVLARFGEIVGQGLAFVLLAIVNLFVLTPIALVMRIVRHDPLAPGARPTGGSTWRGHRARSFPDRPYADERGLWSPLGGDQRRLRPVTRATIGVGIVSLLMIGDLGAGFVFDAVRDASTRSAAYARVASQFDPVTQPALTGLPWASEMIESQRWLPATPDPLLGYRLSDFESGSTNVRDGVRASYQPATAADGLEVYFFGGSALFGEGQRDARTIPSEVARLAEADGISIEVFNYGRPGVATWQELELYEQLVSEGAVPDVVVFYDGFNDLAWQLNLLLSPEPTNVFDTRAAEAAPSADGATREPGSAPVASDVEEVDRDTGFDDVLGAYWDQAASRHLYEVVRDLVDPPDVQPPQFADDVAVEDPVAEGDADEVLQAARNAVAIQLRAARVATAVAESTGSAAAFYWQPFVYTKEPLHAGEVSYRGFPGYEPARWEPSVAEARALLRPPYVDLGDALNGASTPVLWDFVHTNEEGARLVAEAMYRDLRPTLERLQRLKSSP